MNNQNLPNNPNIEVVKATETGLFTNYIFKAIPLAFDESMSYYETLCGILSYLKDTILPTLNNNADAVVELQTLYIALKSYVDNAITEYEQTIDNQVESLENYMNNYFNNLDVQQEINNKLDEMALSGELTDIIAQYLGLAGMIVFSNVADMKIAENLVNGSKCKTMGYHTPNDGGSATYLIRTKRNDDVINESTLIAVYNDLLVAELIIENQMTPESFGAYGDDIHDDTTAIEKAIENCNVVTFLDKTYSILNIQITKVKDVILKGNKTTLHCNRTSWANLENATKGSLITNNTMTDTINYLEIDNIKFDGNCSNATEDITVTNKNFDMVDLKNITKVVIKNCEFTNSYQGALGVAGAKICEIKNNIFHSIGKGAINSLVLARNAINIRGRWYNRTTSQNVYVDNTNYIIQNNIIYDVVDEVFMISGIKDVTIENNDIHDFGQYFVEYFADNTYVEHKTLNVTYNNIYNSGSTIFNFDNSYTINGTLKLDCSNNNILNIGGFTTYRNENGKHYISNVTDYSRLITHLTNETTFKAYFRNNKMSLAESTASPFFRLTCECYVINNEIDVTTLTSRIISGSGKPVHFINNKIYATDDLATRYSLFGLYKDSNIINNDINVKIKAYYFELFELDLKIQNNKFKDNIDTISDYHVICYNAATSGDCLIFSNNVIEAIRTVFDSNLTNNYGTCLFVGNIMNNVTALGSNNKFATISKQSNYPLTFND